MNINRKTTISEEVKLANTNGNTVSKETKRKITASKIIRWSGLSAIAAGLIFAGIQPIHPLDVISSVHTNLWMIITSLKTAMSVFAIIGITGLYARQAEKTGWLGLAGYLSLIIFYAIQMCYSFTEVLIFPLLTTEAPKFVSSALGMSSGAGGPMNLGAFATVFSILPVLYLAGLVLFGIATFRARILSRWAAILLAISGPLALVMVALLPHQLERFAAVPMGIALAWLGYSLLTGRQEPVSDPCPDLGSLQLSQSGAD